MSRWKEKLKKIALTMFVDELVEDGCVENEKKRETVRESMRMDGKDGGGERKLEVMVMDGEEEVSETVSKRRKFKKYSVLKVFMFAAYLFTYAMLLAFINNMMLPIDVNDFVGEEAKPTTLGILLGIVSATYLTGPILGNLCDKTPYLSVTLCKKKKFELGKRKPWLVVGMVLYLCCLQLRTFVKWDGWFCFSVYSILSVFGAWASCVSQIAFTALIPDLFHRSQLNLVSSCLGFMNLLGQTVALGVFGLIYDASNYYLLVFGVVCIGVIGVIPILFFKESDSVMYKKLKKDLKKKKVKLKFNLKDKEERKQCCKTYTSFILDYLKPFGHFNFTIAFISRFCFVVGFASISSFQMYFLKDCVKNFAVFGIKLFENENEEAAQSVSAYVVFAFGVFAAFLGPAISKKITRKWTVFFSGLLMILALLAWIISREYTTFLVFSSLWGAGSASMNALFFALITECLPSKQEAAKDLAIFGLANIIPYAVSSPTMGIIINWGNEIGDQIGYVLLFTFSIISIGIGTFIIILIRKPKKKKDKTKELVDKEFDDDDDSSLTKKFLTKSEEEGEEENKFINEDGNFDEDDEEEGNRSPNRNFKVKKPSVPKKRPPIPKKRKTSPRKKPSVPRKKPSIPRKKPPVPIGKKRKPPQRPVGRK